MATATSTIGVQGAAPQPVVHARPLTFEDLFDRRRLSQTARAIRREVRLIRARDAVDWVDWFLSLDSSLLILSKEVIEGSFYPSAPTRYEVGKSRGTFRMITALNIRDAVVYRHLADEALERAISSKVPGAFFSRRHSATPIGNTLTVSPDPYHAFFEIWLKYNQYRTRTLLNHPYQILVVSDITNYFESITHELLIEYLSPLQLPRKAVALLGRLLEALKPPSGHSPNPRVGLPTDELDCSREFAHLFLFEHDRGVADRFGEKNYVRWMDDQSIGVGSMSEARAAMNHLTRSLSAQRLTINAGKTKFLTPTELVEHFQLDANEQLDRWDKKYKTINAVNTRAARMDFAILWRKLLRSPHAEKGNWDKILRRIYAAATKVDSPILEKRSLRDLVAMPDLDERVFQYFAKRNRGRQLLTIFQDYCGRGENLFEATESAFFESLLLLDPSPQLGRDLRKLAMGFARGSASGQAGRPLGRASAILALYWFGEPQAGLRSIFDASSARRIPKEVARAWLAVTFAVSPRALGWLQARLVGHPSEDVARLSDFLLALRASGSIQTLGNYKHQRNRWPLPGKYYDARSWLILDTAAATKDPRLRAQLQKDLPSFQRLARSVPEKRIAARIALKLR
jgi:hypothetical protein